MGLRDQHAEEAVRLDEIPDLVGHPAFRMPDLPVVDPPAQLFRRTVEEGALLRRQRNGRHGAELGPIGAAREDLGIEAHGAGVEGLLLGVGHLREDLADELEDGLDQGRAADGGERQQPQCDEAEPHQTTNEPDVGGMDVAVEDAALPGEDHETEADRPLPGRSTHHAERDRDGDQGDQKQDQRHHSLRTCPARPPGDAGRPLPGAKPLPDHELQTPRPTPASPGTRPAADDTGRL